MKVPFGPRVFWLCLIPCNKNLKRQDDCGRRAQIVQVGSYSDLAGKKYRRLIQPEAVPEKWAAEKE